MAIITQFNGTQTFIIGSTTVSTIIDFGFSSGEEGDIAQVTVLSTDVKADSKIVCSPSADPTTDHDPDDASLEGIVVTATNIVPGVSFDIIATAVNNSWGRYNVTAVF